MPKYMFPLNHVQDILEPFETFKIMKDVFGALEHLHQVGYVHNDLKPSNIMIDEGIRATLIDLGFASKFMLSPKQHMEAPEHTGKFRGNMVFSSVQQMDF